MYFHDTGANSSCSWQVDYNLDGIYTDEGNITGKNFDRTERYLIIGSENTSTTYNFQIEGLKVDDDSYPADCIR